MPNSKGTLLLVMGVTGCGKSTFGAALARRLNIPFYDADDFHPPANREKLNRDIPLDDADRQPWLELLATKIRDWQAAGDCVLACSALKRHYRSTLLTGNEPYRILYLKGSAETIAARLDLRRHSHELVKDYTRILAGQFRDLEEPEEAIAISVELSMDAMLEIAIRELRA